MKLSLGRLPLSILSVANRSRTQLSVILTLLASFLRSPKDQKMMTINKGLKPIYRMSAQSCNVISKLLEKVWTKYSKACRTMKAERLVIVRAVNLPTACL